MTEGGISSWKKKEGETFAAGDVLLEIVSEQPRRYNTCSPRPTPYAGDRQGYYRRGGAG